MKSMRLQALTRGRGWDQTDSKWTQPRPRPWCSEDLTRSLHRGRCNSQHLSQLSMAIVTLCNHPECSGFKHTSLQLKSVGGSVIQASVRLPPMTWVWQAFGLGLGCPCFCPPPSRLAGRVLVATVQMPGQKGPPASTLLRSEPGPNSGLGAGETHTTSGCEFTKSEQAEPFTQTTHRNTSHLRTLQPLPIT